ncbi:MAG: LuxR C-terminal-related transcriptional regulator, partial [Sphingomonas sp.]
LDCAAPPGPVPVAATVMLRDPGSLLPPLVVDVLPLPRGRWSLAMDARVLVVPRRPRRPGNVGAVLEAGYRLTAAEAAIAVALAAGQARGEIAARRGVSIGTIRTQLKSVFQKMSVTREVDLVARINALS